MNVPEISLRCPGCGAAFAEPPLACSSCGVPLEGYWRAFYRPWHAYRRALDAIRERRLARASREAFLAVSLEPNRCEFRWLSASLLAELGELDDAAEQALTALELQPDNEPLRTWCESLLLRRVVGTPNPIEPEPGTGEGAT